MWNYGYKARWKDIDWTTAFVRGCRKNSFTVLEAIWVI